MNIVRRIWPEDNQSLWNIKNQEYIIEIKWSKVPFEECCHDLSKLFTYYDAQNENYLLEEEKQWLIKYLASIEEVDEKSDMFRFPFEDEFLAQYRNKFLDNVAVANNMIQAFSIISKCLNCGVYDLNSEFEADLEPKFLILASHGIGNCYLWEPISDNGFHTKITGYTDVADFIFYKCDNITLEEKIYPIIFLLRNSIELCLKRLFYSSVDNSVPKHIFFQNVGVIC